MQRLNALFNHLLTILAYSDKFINTFLTQNANIILAIGSVVGENIFQTVQIVVNNIQYQSIMKFHQYRQRDIVALTFYFNEFYPYFDSSKQRQREIQEKFWQEYRKQAYEQWPADMTSGETFFNEAILYELIGKDPVVLSSLLLNDVQPADCLTRVANMYSSFKANPVAVLLNYFHTHKLINVSGALLARVLKSTLGDTLKATATIQALLPELRARVPLDDLLQTGAGLEMLSGMGAELNATRAEATALDKNILQQLINKTAQLQSGLNVEGGQVCAWCKEQIDYEDIDTEHRVIVYFCGHCFHDHCQVEI